MPHLQPLYHRLGAMPFFERLSANFYRDACSDALLGPLFTPLSAATHVPRFAHYLAQALGGPGVYTVEDKGSETYMLSRHAGRNFSEEQRRRWVDLLLQSAEEAGLPAEDSIRRPFTAYILRTSRYIVECSQANTIIVDQRNIIPWTGNDE